MSAMPRGSVVRGHRAPGEADSSTQELAALVEHGLFDYLAASRIAIDGDTLDSLEPKALEFATASGRRARGYSMIRSARRMMDCGIFIPSALALLILTTSSNCVGCATGRSDGRAPFDSLSIYAAALR